MFLIKSNSCKPARYPSAHMYARDPPPLNPIAVFGFRRRSFTEDSGKSEKAGLSCKNCQDLTLKTVFSAFDKSRKIYACKDLKDDNTKHSFLNFQRLKLRYNFGIINRQQLVIIVFKVT